MAKKTDKYALGRVLAKMFYEEFDAGGWGDVDPYWFANVADGTKRPKGEEERAYEDALEELLERVARKFNTYMYAEVQDDRN